MVLVVIAGRFQVLDLAVVQLFTPQLQLVVVVVLVTKVEQIIMLMVVAVAVVIIILLLELELLMRAEMARLHFQVLTTKAQVVVVQILLEARQRFQAKVVLVEMV